MNTMDTTDFFMLAINSKESRRKMKAHRREVAHAKLHYKTGQTARLQFDLDDEVIIFELWNWVENFVQTGTLMVEERSIRIQKTQHRGCDLIIGWCWNAEVVGNQIFKAIMAVTKVEKMSVIMDSEMRGVPRFIPFGEIKRVNELFFSVNPVLSREDFEVFVARARPTKTLIVNVRVNAHFPVDYGFKTEELIWKRNAASFWGLNLMSSDLARIVLRHPNITLEDLNKFLKRWKRGSFNKLEYVSIQYDGTSKNVEDVVLADLDRLEDHNYQRPICVDHFKGSTTFANRRDLYIKRSDGKVAGVHILDCGVLEGFQIQIIVF